MIQIVNKYIYVVFASFIIVAHFLPIELFGKIIFLIFIFILYFIIIRFIKYLNFETRSENMYSWANLQSENKIEIKLTNAIKYNFILNTFVFSFIFLDIFLAKLSLSSYDSSAYILYSVFFKIIFFIIYGFYKNKFILNPRKYLFNTMSISLFFLYLIFDLSKFLSYVVIGFKSSENHTTLPYIFGAYVLFSLVIILLQIKKDFILKQSVVLDTLFYSTLVFIFINILSLLFLNINTIDGISFFMAGISLFFLTLLYHLFYRIHTYIQLA